MTVTLTSAGDIQMTIADDIHVTGSIDNQGLLVLESTTGSIIVEGKIDNHSVVSLKAAKDVAIGALTTASDENRKIDGNSSVSIVCGGSFTLGSYVHNANLDVSAHGSIALTGVDYGAIVHLIADGEVMISGDIDGNNFDHGPSRVDAVSNRASIRVQGMIKGRSNVFLTAAGGISIELDIHDRSCVTAIAGHDIKVQEGVLDGSVVDLAAGGAITVQQITGDSIVRLLSATKSITVTGIDGGATEVLAWPVLPSPAVGTGGATVKLAEWAKTRPILPTPLRDGFLWRNWPQTLAYVAPFRVVPRSLKELIEAVVGTPTGTPGAPDFKPDATPVKAMGGGWSFSDAALPLQTADDVLQTSLIERGRWQKRGLHDVLEGIPGAEWEPMDLAAQAAARNAAFSTQFSPAHLRQETRSGAELPASPMVRLIDTRALASSLQQLFDERLGARPAGSERVFYVEAGITVADLQQLLDHQKPRLAMHTSGGSPGATLAGAISTATHGGEPHPSSPLLADCIRAIHLVGPGGQQWWIEGASGVSNEAKVKSVYENPADPLPTSINFVGGGWAGIAGLTAEDILAAVAVSMGTMGVIYSVVLAVREQYGLRQVIAPTRWRDLLALAKVSEDDLRHNKAAANQAIVTVLLDGAVNGTGIAAANNLYADLAINPYPRRSPNDGVTDRDCWVTNRIELGRLPDDDNGRAPALGDYAAAVSRAINGAAQDTVQWNRATGRLFDFLSWGTDIIPNALQNLNQASRLARFIGGLADPSAGVLAAASAQVAANLALEAVSHPDRGLPFIADVLSGFFHALEGTAVQRNAETAAVAYKVGAIGWPGAGLPGRALEVALDASTGFSFLQQVVFDQWLDAPDNQTSSIFGYVSVRLCPRTSTLMGMQQFAFTIGRTEFPNVMIEIVGFRTPESDHMFDMLQELAVKWPGAGPGSKPLLHWGLENDRPTPADLAASPLGQPYKSGFTRLSAFQTVRSYLRGANPPVFDNNFTNRLNL